MKQGSGQYLFERKTDLKQDFSYEEIEIITNKFDLESTTSLSPTDKAEILWIFKYFDGFYFKDKLLDSNSKNLLRFRTLITIDGLKSFFEYSQPTGNFKSILYYKYKTSEYSSDRITLGELYEVFKYARSITDFEIYTNLNIIVDVTNRFKDEEIKIIPYSSLFEGETWSRTFMYEIQFNVAVILKKINTPEINEVDKMKVVSRIRNIWQTLFGQGSKVAINIRMFFLFILQDLDDSEQGHSDLVENHKVINEYFKKEFIKWSQETFNEFNRRFLDGNENIYTNTEQHFNAIYNIWKSGKETEIITKSDFDLRIKIVKMSNRGIENNVFALRVYWQWMNLKEYSFQEGRSGEYSREFYFKNNLFSIEFSLGLENLLKYFENCNHVEIQKIKNTDTYNSFKSSINDSNSKFYKEFLGKSDEEIIRNYNKIYKVNDRNFRYYVDNGII
jgi:hypothetical protein